MPETVWVIQGQYGHGWEDVTADDDRAVARGLLADYRTNDPDHPYRMVRGKGEQ